MEHKDAITIDLKPCPICHVSMQIRQTESYATRIDDPWYFIYCRCCGYGPNQAFDSSTHARQQWNQITL
ncbi:hypothetical protein BH10PSE19_BH10PSE19_00500 [soil metagenome]